MSRLVTRPSLRTLVRLPDQAEARLAGRLAAGGVGAAVAALPLLLLLLLVRSGSGPLVRLDRAVADELNAWALDRPWAVTVLEVLEVATDPWTLRVVLVVLAVRWWRAGARRTAVWAVTTVFVGGAVNQLLKWLVRRDRPTFDDAVAHSSFYSFPSGHAAGSVLFAAVVLVVVVPTLSGVRRGLAVGAGAALVLVTGFDRVALGVHYLSDVVAGWVLATAVVTGTTIAFGITAQGSTRRFLAPQPARERRPSDGVAARRHRRPGPRR